MIVDTIGPSTAKIFLVGEAPGKDEDISGKPFCGYAGRTLNWLLGQAGINRNECLIGNVARERPLSNKISFWFQDKECTVPKPKMSEWIKKLQTEIDFYKPNVVVALGATALWTLTGEKYISKHRGYVMESTLCPGTKVLPTYHPQNVNYEWRNFFSTVMDLRKAKYHSEFPEIPEDRRHLYPNVSLKEFLMYCQELISDNTFEKVALDIETLQPGCHINIIGLSHLKDYAMNIALIKNKSACFSENEEHELWYWIDQVLRAKKVIMHNASFDANVLLFHHHILPNLYMDTLIAAHALWPELPRDLGYLASLCLDIPVWKTKSGQDLYLYNAGDCAATFGIAEFFEKEMVKQKVDATYRFEMSQLPVASMLQLNGVNVDKGIQKQLKSEATVVIEKTGDDLSNLLKIQIYDKVTGKSVMRSTKKLQKILYIDLGLPVQYKRRKSASDPRKITTDKEAIARLAILVPNNPIFNLILEHRKNLSLRKFIDIETSLESKVYTSYNITGKKDNKDEKKVDEEGRKSFGRWSSSKSIILPFGSGNLQNIPPIARKMYRAPGGFEWVAGDLVQAEAVVVAYLTGDQTLIKLYEDRLNAPFSEKGKYDVHNYTASMMYKVKLDDVTPEQRKVGKTLRHALAYDAGPAVVAARLGVSLSEGKHLKEIFHQANPRLLLWYKEIQDKLGNDRTLITPIGRKHRFLDRWSDDLWRSAYAFLPQSTVGDILNEALVELYNLCGDILDIKLQLHDAIYVWSPLEHREETISYMRSCMQRKVEINNRVMEIEADFKAGPSWGEMEDVKEA
jgi:uracil-DNA glycosylase family 4